MTAATMSVVAYSTHSERATALWQCEQSGKERWRADALGDKPLSGCLWILEGAKPRQAATDAWQRTGNALGRTLSAQLRARDGRTGAALCPAALTRTALLFLRRLARGSKWA